MKYLDILKNIFISVRFPKFLLVGLTGIFVNMFFLWFFKEYSGLTIQLSSILAIFLSVVSNFALNNSWTFKNNSSKHKTHITFFKYFISVLIGMILNYTILIFLTSQLSWNYLFSNLVGIAFGTISNYLFSSLWAWKE